jgi:hypothetical protein
MAAKRTLKYKGNRLRPIPDIVDDAIEYCLRVIKSPSYKGTVSDLLRLLRFSLELNPIKPKLRPPVWVDT